MLVLPTDEEIVAFIAKYLPTPAHIHMDCYALGIRGKKRHSFETPAAILLKRAFGFEFGIGPYEEWQCSNYFIVYPRGLIRAHDFPVIYSVLSFTNKFDRGEYPQLVYNNERLLKRNAQIPCQARV